MEEAVAKAIAKAKARYRVDNKIFKRGMVAECRVIVQEEKSGKWEAMGNQPLSFEK